MKTNVMEKIDSFGATLANFAIRRPVTTTMFFISMLLLGLVASKLLPLEKFPGIEVPEVEINVPYPNSTPAEVERLITRPIEEALATISGIEKMESRSTESGAYINIEFKWSNNVETKSIEARERIDAINHLLPDDIQRILVYQFNTADMPVFKLRISSKRDLSGAYDLLDRNLKRPIERVQGVSKVDLYGVEKRQITIRLNSDKVAALGISNDELLQVLSKNNFSSTAGHLYADNSKILVNPVGEYRSLDDINNVIVKDNIRIIDIAQVSFEQPIKTEGRHLDQSYAIGMDIFKESNANLVEVADRVLKVIEQTENNPQFDGINLMIMDNMAQGVSDSLSDLLSAGLLGALLSVIVLYGFLRHAATTLIVVLSVPFAICITLGMMYLMDYSLNILSMMGLMLAIGMLVDNAVVITESIFHERQQLAKYAGDKTLATIQATKAGVSKVSLAIIAGTATTAIVFLPNVVGKKVEMTIFLSHVAIAIIISLVASLFIAQTLIPLLTSKITMTPKANKQNRSNKPSRYFHFYQRSLKWSIKHQKSTSFIALVLLCSIAIPMSQVNNDEDRDRNRDRISLNYNINSSYSLDEVEQTVSSVEAYLYDNQEKFHIDSVYSYYNTNFAYSSIQFKKDMPIAMSQMKQQIKENWPVIARGKLQFGWGGGGSGGVRVNLYGNSTDELIRIADNLVPTLAKIDGLEDVKSDVAGEQKELQIKIDRVLTHRLGLSTNDVANAISLALRGNNLRSFRHNEYGEIDIMVNFEIELSKSVEALKKLPIMRTGEQVFTLDSLADITITRGLDDIRRIDRQTGLTITANLAEELKLDDAREHIKGVLENLELPAGNRWSLDGSFKKQDEDMAIMGQNMLLALILIYIVMAALFESLLLPTAVITSLILSIVGVFWAFLITGTSMSVMGMIGILILMGIVVNNGIVLVDRINQLIEEGADLSHAIIEGSLSRVRPILMTVSTTVLGLVPLAMGATKIGGDGPAYSPMAIAIIGGLIFSTITSLYLVPLAYILLLKLRYRCGLLLVKSQLVVSKTLAKINIA